MYCTDDADVMLTQKCTDIAQLKGVEAKRLSFLYDGTNQENLEIPPLRLYTYNGYKKYNYPNFTTDKLQKIIELNSFEHEYKKGKIYKTLFGLRSLINHSRETNVKIEWISPS